MSILRRTIAAGSTLACCALVAAPSLRIDYPVLPLSHQSQADRSEWLPVADSLPVEPITVDGLPAVRFTCNLSTPDLERVAWDISVNVDLSMARGVRFMFRCANIAPVSGFSFYFKSGNGWYAASFNPEGAGEWQEVEILKADTRAEGGPSGWGRIELLRVSAWRAALADTAFDVAGIGVIRPRTRIAVIRGISAVPDLTLAEANCVYRYARNVCNALDAYGVNPMLLDDIDVTTETLRSLQLVMLPYNPDMPDGVVPALVAFLEDGGRVIGFYTMPAELQAPLGIRKGEYLSGTHFPAGLGSIVFQPNMLRGAPDRVRQASWNIQAVHPVPGKSRPVAVWHDTRNAPTGAAAVVASDSGMWMSHVYLAQDRAAGDRMLLAMAGAHARNAWRLAAHSAVRGAAKSLSRFDRATSPAATDSVAENETVRTHIARAEGLLSDAVRLNLRAAHVAALQRADAAKRSAVDAFFCSQRPLDDEFRAVWCHRGYGIKHWSWDKSVKHLAELGFNALLPNMATGNSASYPTQLLAVDPVVKEQGDQLALCLDACRRYGVQLHVWKVCFNTMHKAAPEFVDRMREAGRVQQSISGANKRVWLCPSHPENQKLEVDALAEVVKKYPVDGVHLDFIRYPGRNHCVCAGCRVRFEAYINGKTANWPDEVRQEGALEEQWLEFRRHNITTVVRGVHEAVKAVNPSVKVSAAVFSNWLSVRDTLGQDWVDWCRKGYLDFVCPMNYTASDSGFQAMLNGQLQPVRPTGVPLYPGIGLSVVDLDAVALINQIKISRKAGTGGFVLFEYDEDEAVSILPQLAKGLTRAAPTPP